MKHNLLEVYVDHFPASRLVVGTHCRLKATKVKVSAIWLDDLCYRISYFIFFLQEET